MKALIFNSIGEPSEVLRLENIDEVKPGRDEVLLQMLFSPVNPSDLHMVRGRYGYQPALPASTGADGVGKVLEIGTNVIGVHVGDRVICIGTWNLWRDRECETTSTTMAHELRIASASDDSMPVATKVSPRCGSWKNNTPPSTCKPYAADGRIE